MNFENQYCHVSLSDNGVGTLSIQHAGHLNILSSAVINGLLEGFAHVRSHAAYRVLIVRGEGDKAFVAGADIKEMAALNADNATVFIDKLRQLCDAPRMLPIPVIARIPGWALGGGLEFALCCDLRVASTNTKMGMPEVKVGIPSIIHAALMPRLIGKTRSSWLLLTGEVIDAEKALSWGMIDQLVSPDNLDVEVKALADNLAALGPKVLSQQKRLLREWEDEPAEVSIMNGVKEFASAYKTGEPEQYMSKFLGQKAKNH